MVESMRGFVHLGEGLIKKNTGRLTLSSAVGPDDGLCNVLACSDLESLAERLRRSPRG